MILSAEETTPYMSERMVAPVPESGSPPAAFPGSTGVTVLDVYDWTAPDGLAGGAAHVHLASSEGYVVLSGTGRLQTLGADGYAETPLRPGDCLWFTPGTIHRPVNDGGLRLLVVMANAGLREHGDAVLTFGPEILADAAAYERAAALPSGAGDAEVAEAARTRAARAVEGFAALREAVSSEGVTALEDFYKAAAALRRGLIDDWLGRWQSGSLATAQKTAQHLYGVGSGDTGHLASGSGLWRIESPAGERAYGMSGRLTVYPPGAAVKAG